MKPLSKHARSERGAILVHVAIALIGLTAFSTFVIDYGVLWTARRQAQNSADAAAMAGAVSMGFVDMNNQALARQAALDTAALNRVWGVAPDVTPADVTFPQCPAGSPGVGTNSCIRVAVFRNERPGGNPLPTFFGNLVGITQQGVRATATAEVLFGDSTDCVKPFAIPDKWIENHNDSPPAGWDEEDTFERYVPTGNNAGELLPSPDYYEPPGVTGGAYAPNGTGYTRDSTSLGGSDYGRYITLKSPGPHEAIAPGWYHPIVLTPGEGGGDNYRDNIATCNRTVIGAGSVLEVEPGNMVGPTRQGMDDLWEQDRQATWNPSLNNGQGGIQGGCMAAGTCSKSPRLVAIPVYNPDAYDALPHGGRIELQITKVLGFFIDRIRGNEVSGWIITYPAAPRGGTSDTPGAAFVISIALVR